MHISITDADSFKLTAYRLSPVSYTHLDVYKRQAMDIIEKVLNE